MGDFPEFGEMPGVELSAIAAGIKYPDRLDFVLFEFAPGTQMAAVFTQNKFCAAPVEIAKQHLSDRQLESSSYWLVNTGYANAGTGKQGLVHAKRLCKKIAEARSVSVQQVLPFSTGVIGEYLPMETLLSETSNLCDGLTKPNVANRLWQQVAAGIMTTDTRPKGAFFKGEWQGQSFSIGGVTKGAGMIKPNMATMLAFLVTDLSVDADILQTVLKEVVDESFNAISVDGDTSTNDACVIAATGKSAVGRVSEREQDLLHLFKTGLAQVCRSLALAIVEDGEGATKRVEICVKGAQTKSDARAVADAVAHSSLVKTAFFAEDPNWGRILAAVGYAPVADLNIDKVDLYFDQVQIMAAGEVVESYREKDAAAVLRQRAFSVIVDLNQGDQTARVWTADLSYEYVKINAEYRS